MSQALPPEERITEPHALHRLDLSAFQPTPLSVSLEKNRAEVEDRVAIGQGFFRLGMGLLMLSGVLYLADVSRQGHQAAVAAFAREHAVFLDDHEWHRQVVVRFMIFGDQLKEDRAVDPMQRFGLCEARLREVAQLRCAFEKYRREIMDLLPHAPAEVRRTLQGRLDVLHAALDPKEGTLLQLELLYRQMKEE